ncbi:MAG: PKD domain-containing protein [Thermoplasmatales archaeon]|nr:MAG: PKD domain-containing protein [Thermoplasmatales archaeon]
MKQRIICKPLAVAVIVLFIGLAVQPSVAVQPEGKFSNESKMQIIKNRALINHKSVGMCQSSFNQDCESMCGFNVYPGPEEIICFSLNDPSEYSSVCSLGVAFESGTYGCDGIWYATEYETGILYGIDPYDCDIWLIGGGGVNILDLAYDPITYYMYGSSEDNYLYKINQYTGEQEQIGPFGGGVLYMIGMAFDADGILYGWDLSDRLWTIDTETGEATEVGPLGININYAQGGDFCRATDVLYITAYTTSGHLYECNEDTGECTLIGILPWGMEIAGTIIIQDCTYYPAPPKAPTISGPDYGVINQEYNFTINTTDPNGDDIFYYIEWGDNTSSGWVGPYASGEEVTVNHTWLEHGVYEIKAKAKDILGLSSGWSESFFIDIVKGPEIEIDSIKGGLFRVSAQIKNIGGLEAVNVSWKITLEGGAILGKETTGVLNIPVDGKISINSNFIFGFGPTKLTITADIPESSATESRGGFVLLIYTHVNIGG